MKTKESAIHLAGIMAVIMGGLMLVNALTGIFYLKDIFAEYAPGGMFAELEQKDGMDVYDLDAFVEEMSLGNDVTVYYRENKAMVLGMTSTSVAIAIAAAAFTVFEVIRPGAMWRIRIIAIIALLWEGLNLLMALQSGMNMAWMGYVQLGFSLAATIMSFVPLTGLSTAVSRVILVITGVVLAAYGVMTLFAGFSEGIMPAFERAMTIADMYHEAADIPVWLTAANIIIDYLILVMFTACGILVLACAVGGKCREAVKLAAWISIVLSCVELVCVQLMKLVTAVLLLRYSWLCLEAMALVAVMIAGKKESEQAACHD